MASPAGMLCKVPFASYSCGPAEAGRLARAWDMCSCFEFSGLTTLAAP